MSTLGLPVQLEHFISDLAREVGLSSWRSHGNASSNVTVTLCFTAASSNNRTDECFDSRFRRKSNAQIRRDNLRLEQFKRQKERQERTEEVQRRENTNESTECIASHAAILANGTLTRECVADTVVKELSPVKYISCEETQLCVGNDDDRSLVPESVLGIVGVAMSCEGKMNDNEKEETECRKNNTETCDEQLVEGSLREEDEHKETQDLIRSLFGSLCDKFDDTTRKTTTDLKCHSDKVSSQTRPSSSRLRGSRTAKNALTRKKRLFDDK